MVNISEKQRLTQTENYIRSIFENEGTGHDWWHIHRVRNLALKIAESEGGNFFIIEMAALLHDVDDWKLNGDVLTSNAESWLKNVMVTEAEANKILEIIDQVSYKGAGVETVASSIEAKIVQDADRLDAIGAIGIARTFAYGGNKGRSIYNPDIKPELHYDFESYKKTTAPTINHFYEKLLLLKNRLNTATAIELAEKRHIFMEHFLVQFFEEWNNLD
ncbi:HD domain-containing protein [Draconibacterium sp.]